MRAPGVTQDCLYKYIVEIHCKTKKKKKKKKEKKKEKEKERKKKRKEKKKIWLINIWELGGERS